VTAGIVTGSPDPTSEPNGLVGARVRTRVGVGLVVGWHRSETSVDGRLVRRSYLLVEFDGRGGPRLFPTGTVTVETEAP
jgi:hypothetical protein